MKTNGKLAAGLTAAVVISTVVFALLKRAMKAKGEKTLDHSAGSSVK